MDVSWSKECGRETGAWLRKVVWLAYRRKRGRDRVFVDGVTGDEGINLEDSSVIWPYPPGAGCWKGHASTEYKYEVYLLLVTQPLKVTTDPQRQQLSALHSVNCDLIILSVSVAVPSNVCNMSHPQSASTTAPQP